MSKATIVRDHEGRMDIRVDGRPIQGAVVSNIGRVDGEPMAVIAIPLKCVTFAEADNVVPLAKRVGIRW